MDIGLMEPSNLRLFMASSHSLAMFQNVLPDPNIELFPAIIDQGPLKFARKFPPEVFLIMVRESVSSGRIIQIQTELDPVGNYSIIGTRNPPSPFFFINKLSHNECNKLLQVLVSRTGQNIYFGPENDTIFYHMEQHYAFNFLWKGPNPTQGLDKIRSLTIKGYYADKITQYFIRNGRPRLLPNSPADRGGLQHFTGLQHLTIVLTRHAKSRGWNDTECINKFQGDFKKFYLALGRDVMSMPMPIVKFEFAKKSTKRMPSAVPHYLDGDLSTLDDSYVENTL